jgi:tetraacyldisaccharide 4'-kinase
MNAKRPWAWPLVPLYWTGLRLKDSLRGGVLQVRRLDWPVISVGSLSAGGAGKTPVVIALAKLLAPNGWTVNVLSRGYGREGSGAEQVHPQAPESARRFGDEPVMIAAELQEPHSVWVGADRFRAGQKAEAAFPSSTPESRRRVHLLDDGFQHRGLARASDVVLVTAADLEDRLLPAGDRREPFAALHRADIVVVRECERASVAPLLAPWLRTAGGSGAEDAATLVSHERRLSFNPALPSPSLRMLAFCGVARPWDFTEMLHSEGCLVVKTVIFRDHFMYDAEDVEALVSAARECQAAGFVTTEKDWVKFDGSMRVRLAQAGTVVIARLEAVFLDPRAILNALEARLG